MARRKIFADESPVEETPPLAMDTPEEVAEESADAEPTETAEKAPPPNPSRSWRCPGCNMRWVGPLGSHGHAAYKAHIKRHAHARVSEPNVQAPTAEDLERRNRMV